MRCLLLYELKKLWTNKLIPIMLAALILLDVYLLLSSDSLSSDAVRNKKTLDWFIAEYKQNPEELDKYISDYIYAFEHSENTSGGDAALYPENKYTENDYVFFKRYFLPIRDYGENYTLSVKAATRIASGHIDEYHYLGYPDSGFEITYQKGIVKSYSALLDIDFPLEAVRGYDVYLDYSGFGVISMIAMLICGMVLIIPDKSGGMENILRVSKFGRGKTYFCKLGAAFVYAALVCVLLSFSALGAIGIKCGFSGLSYPIQMLDSFRLCPIMTTIGGGVILTFLLRLLSCFVFLAVIITVSCAAQGYAASFLFGILFTGANYLVANYKFLNDCSPLKNLNFFWSINGKEPLVYWRGIKLFGACVPTLRSLLITYSVLLIICTGLSYALFVSGKKLSVRRSGALFPRLRERTVKLFSGLLSLRKNKPRKRATLIGFELRKIFTPFSVIVIAALMLGTVILSERAFNRSKGYAGRVYDELMIEYSGMWTEEKDEKLQNLKSEYLLIIAQKDIMKARYKNGEITGAEYSEYNRKCDSAESKIDIVKELCDTSRTLRSLAETGKRAEFVNKSGWTMLKTSGFSYIYLICAILLFSNIFACEYRDGFMSIQKATPYGRKTVPIIKLASVTAISALLLLVCEAYQYISVARYFGLPSPLAPAASITVLSGAGDVSIIGDFALTFLRQLAVFVGFSLMAAAVSRFAKKLLPAMAVMAVIAFAPTVFSYFGIYLFDGLSLIRLLSRV